MNHRLLTTSQLANRMGLSPRTVRRMAQDGRIPAERHSRGLVFDMSAIEGAAAVSGNASRPAAHSGDRQHDEPGASRES